jgi:predicted O-linked N-acetylglucosamine transferase (SPINDLY family)
MAELTIQQAFDLALQHHQAGRLPEAEQVYRLILAQQPDHPHALHFLGVIAYQKRQNDLAVDLIRRAVALRPNYPEAHCNLANALKSNGQLDEAIAAYRRAIALRPEYLEAHINLGAALKDHGQLDEAIAAYRQAIALHPDLPEVQNELGNVLRSKGQVDQALAAYRQAISLRPEYADAHNNLGVALRDQGFLDEAMAAYRRAIALNAECAEAYNNLGFTLMDRGESDEAIAAFRRAVALKPKYVEAHRNLANALRGTGRLDEAVAAYRLAIELKPDAAEVHNNLGVALSELGRLDEAIVAYREAIALRPDCAEVYNNLGIALNAKERPDEAVAAYRQAIALQPNYAQAFSNLGNSLKNGGKIDEAIAAFRQATLEDPQNASLASNLVYVLHLDPRSTPATLAEEHRRWNERHARSLPRFSHSPPTGSDAGQRQLRIGYVSPDFREHCASFFILPLLSNHDRGNFEIVCYSNAARSDAVTQQLRGYTDGWRDVFGVSDEELAGMIHDDRIDVLVDLTLHMINGRLLTFARKPAPVQVTWLGYPSTTGLETMDYRLTDRFLDPPGLDDAFYSEKSIRLPAAFWCYDPRVDDLAVGKLPALIERRVTFGCLNNFCKVNADVLKLWAAVLMKIRDSRMLILAPQGSHRQWALDEMARQGVAPSRIEFLDRRPRRDYLQLYNRIDACLDTFPYNGHTTQLDALWMGVPTVTLVGRTAASRGGASILSNIGLPELVARKEEDYVRIAAELASDLPRLSALRSGLRRRMEQSPLMDAPRFVRDIEASFRQMWRNWCETGLRGS